MKPVKWVAELSHVREVALGGAADAVYLPAAKGRAGCHFFARVGGRTETYPFLPGSDTLILLPGDEGGALRMLADSGFAAGEWHLRADAEHAKSKTYRAICP